MRPQFFTVLSNWFVAILVGVLIGWTGVALAQKYTPYLSPADVIYETSTSTAKQLLTDEELVVVKENYLNTERVVSELKALDRILMRIDSKLK